MYDEEVAHGNVTDIPEHKWHRPAWLGVARFRRIPAGDQPGLIRGHWSDLPSVSIAINPPRSITIDVDAITSEDEASMMVLKAYGIRIVSPVPEIC